MTATEGNRKTMPARLGEVFYWGFMGIAYLLMIPTGWILFTGPRDELVTWYCALVCLVPPAICALLGKACLYVLAGRWEWEIEP